MTFGERCEELRNRMGLTRMLVEERAGLGRGAYSRIAESDRLPQEKTITKLASLFGVTEEFLRTGAERIVAPNEPALATAPTRTIVYDDPLPNRAQAIAAMRGSVPDAVLESVRLDATRGDRPVSAWMDTIVERAEELKARRVRLGLEQSNGASVANVDAAAKPAGTREDIAVRRAQMASKGRRRKA